MAWDDAPPQPNELTTASWDNSPPTPDELKDTQGFLSKTASNIIPDLKETAKGLGETVAEGAYEMPKRALETGLEVAAGQPYSETPSGQKDVSLVENAPEELQKMAEPVTHPVKFTEEHPVQQALNAAGLFGALPEGKGAPRVPSEALETPKPTAVEAPAEPVPIREGPEPTFKGASQIPTPPGGPVAPPVRPPEVPPTQAPPNQQPSGLSDLTNAPIQKAKEVKDYISRGYEGFAKKPGAIADVADYVQSKSQMAAAQQMGATPLQARQIGHEGMRAIGQYALDNDIVSGTTGLRGMRAKNASLMNAAGEKLGSFRKAADAVRNPPTDAVDVLQAVKAKLDPVFSRGARSGEAGSYAKALEDVEDSKPTFEGIAETATKLNKAANEANRLKQSHGAYTDVANEISHINNERIKQLLGPQKAAQYEQALREYGVNKKISSMLDRKEAGEVKRLGPGSLTSNLTQKMLDEVGYKVGAKAANKLSTSILKNPGIAKSLPSLFKEFVNHVEDVGQEVTGMYEGGAVPADIGNFALSKR